MISQVILVDSRRRQCHFLCTIPAGMGNKLVSIVHPQVGGCWMLFRASFSHQSCRSHPQSLQRRPTEWPGQTRLNLPRHSRTDDFCHSIVLINWKSIAHT